MVVDPDSDDELEDDEEPVNTVDEDDLLLAGGVFPAPTPVDMMRMF